MPTYLEYLRGIADALGEHARFVTTSAGTASTLVTATLVNTQLTATEFAQMTVLPETGATAGETGHIQGGGLERSSGTLTIGDPFTSATASGVTFGLYRLLPPFRENARPSLLEIVNEALRDYLWVEDTITLTGVTGQRHYPIDTDTYPWLTDARRVIEVRRPTTSSDDVPAALNPVAWDWENVGETRRLVFASAPFATGETIAVTVYRPANSRLKKNARLRAVLTGTGVTAVTVADGGHYTALPTITADGGATFTAVMAATPGPITSVTVGAAGVYAATFPPALSVTRQASDTGWADQTSPLAGLSTLTDEAIPDTSDVRTVGLWLAYRALASLRAPGATVAEWLTKAQQWGLAANTLEHVGEPSNRRTNVALIRPALVGGGRAWPSARRGC